MSKAITIDNEHGKREYFDTYDKDTLALAKELTKLFKDNWFTLHDLTVKSIRRYGVNQIAILSRAGYIQSQTIDKKASYRVHTDDESRLKHLTDTQTKHLGELEQLAGMVSSINRRKYNEILIRQMNSPTPLQWFDGSAEPGTPECTCSLCTKPITGPINRVFHATEEREMRFHPECHKTVMEIAPVDSGTIPSEPLVIDLDGDKMMAAQEQQVAPLLDTDSSDVTAEIAEVPAQVDPVTPVLEVVHSESELLPGEQYTWECVKDYHIPGTEDLDTPAILKHSLAVYRDGQFWFAEIWPFGEEALNRLPEFEKHIIVPEEISEAPAETPESVASVEESSSEIV